MLYEQLVSELETLSRRLHEDALIFNTKSGNGCNIKVIDDMKKAFMSLVPLQSGFPTKYLICKCKNEENLFYMFNNSVGVRVKPDFVVRSLIDVKSYTAMEYYDFMSIEQYVINGYTEIMYYKKGVLKKRIFSDGGDCGRRKPFVSILGDKCEGEERINYKILETGRFIEDVDMMRLLECYGFVCPSAYEYYGMIQAIDHNNNVYIRVDFKKAGKSPKDTFKISKYGGEKYPIYLGLDIERGKWELFDFDPDEY